MMKIKSLLLAIVTVMAGLTFTACGSDDDDNMMMTTATMAAAQSQIMTSIRRL